MTATTLPALIKLGDSGRREEHKGQECDHSTNTAHRLHGEIDLLYICDHISGISSGNATYRRSPSESRYQTECFFGEPDKRRLETRLHPLKLLRRLTCVSFRGLRDQRDRVFDSAERSALGAELYIQASLGISQYADLSINRSLWTTLSPGKVGTFQMGFTLGDLG